MESSRRAPRLTLSARVEGLAQYWADVRIVDVSPTGALPKLSLSREELAPHAPVLD
jgi:hypothetical protein